MTEFARVISLKLRPGTINELRKITEQSIVPWLKGRDGFHGLHVVQVAETEVVAFETWISRQYAETAKGEEQRLIQQAMANILAAPPSFSEGKMIVHARGHEPHHRPEVHGVR